MLVYVILVALLLFDAYNVYKGKKSKDDFLKLSLAPLLELLALMALYDLGYINQITAGVLIIPIGAYYFYQSSKKRRDKK